MLMVIVSSESVRGPDGDGGGAAVAVEPRVHHLHYVRLQRVLPGLDLPLPETDHCVREVCRRSFTTWTCC